MLNDIPAARADMREAYLSGAPGILASGLAWAVAAALTHLRGPETGMLALFAGGVLIFPVSLLIGKLLGARSAHAKDNPLGALAMATTFWLIFMLPVAYVVYLQSPALFFPAMLLVIGGRYLAFGSIYGLRLYWALGFALAGAAFAVTFLRQPPLIGAIAGAGIELACAAAAFILHIGRRDAAKSV